MNDIQPAEGTEEYQETTCCWESANSIPCPHDPTWVVVMTKPDEQTFVTLAACSEHLGEAADTMGSTSPGTESLILRAVKA